MKIGKHINLDISTSARLKAYTRQANSYREMREISAQKRSSGWLKTSLVALAPLAAQTLAIPMANAQCGVGAIDNNNMLNTANCDRRLQVDLDGDGSFDVAFGFIASASFIYGTFVNPNSTASIATASAVGAQFFADIGMTGAAASGLNFQSANGGGNLFFLSANGTLGQFTTPVGGSTTGYFVLNVEGNYAFVEITVERPSANDRCLSIGTFGIEDTGNTETVLIGDCSTLPVELSKFEAKTTDTNIVLEWETLSELQNAGFELQRSRDAENFRKIAWIEGVGTSNDPQNYQYKDEKVNSNLLYYYRLKQVDQDGRFEYSEIITATIKDENALHVSDFYPNPTQQWAQLEVQTQNKTTAQIQLFDKAGKVFKRTEQELSKGTNQVRLDLSTFPEGIYFARIDIDGERIYRKLSLVY